MIAKLTLVLTMAAMALYSQSTVFVFFPLKDGTVSPESTISGAKFLSVNEQGKSFGWIVFNTQGVDVKNLSSAIIVLPVKSVKGSGTCGVHELMTQVTVPESKVTASTLHFDDLPIAAMSLDSSFTGRMILLNVTDQVRARTFKGIVLRSLKNCAAEFNSREGVPSPALLCTYEQYNSPRAKWWSGAGRPDFSVGMQGDFYAEMGKGAIFRKSAVAWDSLTSLTPPGPKPVADKKTVKPKPQLRKKTVGKTPNSNARRMQAGGSAAKASSCAQENKIAK